MSVDTPLQRELLTRLKARRNDVRAFVRTARPRVARLTTLSIVSSSVAAALTAGPGLGGTTFTEAMQRVFSISDSSLVWQVLCLVSTVVSIGAAVLVRLDRSKDISAQLANAEMCAGELEWLQTMVEYNELPVQEAAKLYQHYTSKIAFIDESPHLAPSASPPGTPAS